MSANGKRCNERRGLEYHHHNPYGRGGGHDPETISLMCKTHNAYLAEKEYGKEAMERYRRPRGAVREPATTYGFLHPGKRAYVPLAGAVLVKPAKYRHRYLAVPQSQTNALTSSFLREGTEPKASRW